MTSGSAPRDIEPRDFASDQGVGKSGDAPESEPVKRKLAIDGNYYFEICRSRPRHKSMPPENSVTWSWRLLSPAGAAMAEGKGYADLESCRDAVDMLQQKAGSALVSIPS